MKRGGLACIAVVLLALALAVAPAQAAKVVPGETTSHFTIKYDAQPQLYQGTSQVLEDAYRTVDQLVGHLPARIKVQVVNDQSMDRYGQHVEAFSAWNKQSSTIVLRDTTLKDRKNLGVVAKHEICHLGLNEILAHKEEKQYSWMEEGICMVVSSEPLDDAKVCRYIADKGFLTLPEIARAIDSSNYTLCKNGYLQSFSLCKAIAEQFGEKALVDIAASPDPSFDAAFRARTGMDFSAFRRAWEASVRARARGIYAPGEIVIHGCLALDDSR